MGFNPYANIKKKAEASGKTMQESLAATNSQRTGSSFRGSRGNASVSNNSNRGNSGRNNGAPKFSLQKLTAPYNFVPLNDVVLKPAVSVAPDATEAGAYKAFLLNGEAKYSGYFTIEMKNLTPMFIDNGKHEFFTDGSNLCIPGSSLRGAIKNYFKIVTNGTMRTGDDGDVTDKLLYYRTFAAGVSYLRDEYNHEMKETVDNRDVNKSQAGFLVREGKEYFICPASFISQKYADSEFNRRYDRKGNLILQAKINSRIDWHNDNVVVYTGKMDNKKHYYMLSRPQWSRKLRIPEKVMAGYRDDKNAKGIRLLDNKQMAKTGSDGSSLLRGAEAYDYIMPCFYVANGNEVKHFGAGPLYRIPYKESIGEHIPANINADKLDFTALMFGNKDSWSSRVFFENLYLQNDAGKEKEAFMIPLMGANPTSFQNYLEPIDKYNAHHWNDEDAKIRGYKMYWHRKCDWRRPANAANTNENVTKKIAPLKPGCSFIGKIRFENLSAVELGALVKVLSLGDNGKSAYKLGMGKSIGMGSVELQSKLFIQEDNYYTKLFGVTGFDAGVKEADKNKFNAAFDNYLKQMLNANSLRLYQEKMQELTLIMDKAYLEQRDWPDKTAYMDINDREGKKISNSRIPLPSIKEVVKK